MPNISVSLSEEDYDQLKGPSRSAKLRQILKERREHKCPERKPCGEVHARVDKKKGLLLEFPDARGKWVKPQDL